MTALIILVLVLCAAPEAKQRLKQAEPRSKSGRYLGDGTRQKRCNSSRTESPECVGNERTTPQLRYFFNHTSGNCESYTYYRCPFKNDAINGTYENSFKKEKYCHLLCRPDGIKPR
ncbi:unnamed protein product [Cylicocyclus nassatus]|uniref:BPTI/Kunitz inhibitor domain-containing protein n=1 Tax=Cylicocyclus nassatus TaxID=53992 RepID=A0AA36GNS4_CYLNA|nr:unnamed protein product [Cylicocyclus nassatus]